MLGGFYRIVMLNNSGQTMNTVNVVAKRWSFNANGVATWEAGTTTIWNSSSLACANGNYAASAWITNTSAGYLGGTFEIQPTTPASASGTLTFYLQRSIDGSTAPDNGTGQILKVFSVAASTTYTDMVEV